MTKKPQVKISSVVVCILADEVFTGEVGGG